MAERWLSGSGWRRQGYILRSRGTRGDTVNFIYKRSQTSTLGIGVSAKAQDAGFSAHGTETESSSRELFYPKQHGNSWFRTNFRVARYRQFCLGRRGHPQKGCPRRTPDGATDIIKCLFKLRSNGWHGGESLLHPRNAPHTLSFNCDPFPAGSKFGSDFGAAKTWSKGFELAADGIGFNAQTQTGYDKNGFMLFTFARRSVLCGTNGPEATAAQLVARANQPPH